MSSTGSTHRSGKLGNPMPDAEMFFAGQAELRETIELYYSID